MAFDASGDIGGTGLSKHIRSNGISETYDLAGFGEAQVSRLQINKYSCSFCGRGGEAEVLMDENGYTWPFLVGQDPSLQDRRKSCMVLPTNTVDSSWKPRSGMLGTQMGALHIPPIMPSMYVNPSSSPPCYESRSTLIITLSWVGKNG